MQGDAEASDCVCVTSWRKNLRGKEGSEHVATILSAGQCYHFRGQFVLLAAWALPASPSRGGLQCSRLQRVLLGFAVWHGPAPLDCCRIG